MPISERSNQPGTCLWCGRKLYYSHRKEARYTNTVTLCCQAPIVEAMKRGGGWQFVKSCSVCHREITGEDDTEKREHVTPASVSEHAGYFGFFDTRICGFNFGLAFARAGRRLVPIVPEEAASSS